MKRFVNRILVTGLFALGTNALFAAPAPGDFFENWYHKKYGRPTPAAEARIEAERAETAYRAAEHPAPIDLVDVYFRAKLGRPSPAAEARLKAARESAAFREESPKHPARLDPNEAYMKGKLGRTPTR